MPTFYDDKTKSWFCKFYYTDYTGIKKQKKKRGFKLQRDAKEWERNFLQVQQGELTMPLSDFVNIYLNDMDHRVRQSTQINKRKIIRLKIIPALGDMPLNEITPSIIRKWQTDLITDKNKKNEPYSQTYLKTIHSQLSSIFNYAVRYYGLKQNPCTIAGTIGKSKRDNLKFWTMEDFKQFISCVDEQLAYTIFMTLYYTGVRLGELLALTLSDLDLSNGFIDINKSMQRIDKKYVITPPKTRKSIRKISIPLILTECLKSYIATIYKPCSSDLLFQISREPIRHKLNSYCNIAGVIQIRLHDFRHSHASLLIEMGFSPLLIAERLGHESIDTTLNIYGHLFPNKQNEVVNRLQELSSTILVPPTFKK